MSYEAFFAALAFFLALYFITRAWIWCAALFFSALAAFFAMIASIFHFQILGALGFFVLGCILWTIFRWVLEAKYDV